MSERTISFNVESGGYTTAGQDEWVAFFPSGGTNEPFGANTPLSMSFSFPSSEVYANYTSNVTIKWDLRIRAGGWHTLYSGSSTMNKNNSDFSVYNITIPDGLRNALKSSRIEEIGLYQTGSRSIKGTSSATASCTISVRDVTIATAPTITSVTQNNDGTYTVSWSPAVLSTGSSDGIVYDLWDVNNGGVWQGNIQGTSVTRTIPGYNTSYTFMIGARYNSSDPYGNAVNSAHFSKTFYHPFVSAPSLSASGTSGQSVTLSWTAATLHYTTASKIEYKIYVNGNSNPTVSTILLKFNASETFLKRFGLGTHTFVVEAVASGLSDTSAGTTLTSPKSNAVSFTYELSTTACSPPTSVSVSATDVEPGAQVQLSWSGASGGTGNAIAKYEVYRATSASGAYTKLMGVTSSSTSGSTAVSAPASNGASYYYKVRTVGSASGYESELSSVYATLTCKFSNPSPPTVVTIDGKETAYTASGANVTLSWSGASGGTNNPIQGYVVYQDGALYQETTDTQLSVPANTTVGGSHTYTVKAKGKHSSSIASIGRAVYTYGLPNPPRKISAVPNVADANTDVTLSWEGAAAGKFNDITGYVVYRAASAYGEYAYLTEVTSSQTSASCIVKAPPAMGNLYYFKVRTVGQHAQSDLSGSFVSVQVKSYSKCQPPASFELESTSSTGGTVRLVWSAASGGTNNPVVDYEVQYQDSTNGGTSYGAWNSLGTTADTFMNVSPPSTPGHYRRYRIQVRGSAGASYYADWKISSNMLYRDYTPCTAPTTVSLSAAISRESVLLTWSGALAGDGNAIAGYEVQSCDSENGLSWGNWSAVSSVTGQALSVWPPARAGSYRKFRVRAKGSAGDGYHSGWAESKNTLMKDFTSCTPPATCALSSTVSVVDVTLAWSGASAGDGNAIARYEIERCERSSGAAFGAWSPVESSQATSTSLLVSPPSSAGVVYKFRVRAVGSAGEAYASAWKESSNTLELGHEALKPFTDETLVAKQTYVKAIHMTELQHNVNLLLKWYGLTPASFTPIAGAASSAPTYLKDWKTHIEELRAAIDRIPKEHEPWIAIPVNVPRADVVMQLRSIVMNM